MGKLPVILDLETKEKFRDVNYNRKKLGVSVVGVYDYTTRTADTFFEREFGRLFQLLESCSYIIGFNIKSFDIPLLQGYYPGDFSRFLIFDILDDIKEKIGRRLSLNDLLSVTLRKRKTGHGLMAIDYFREGKLEELKNYCMDDVMLTKELFDHGVENGSVNYRDEKGEITLAVDWKKYLTSPQNQTRPLTLPF